MIDPYESREVFFNLSDFSEIFDGIDLLFYGRGPLSSNVYILNSGRTLIDTGNSLEILYDLENHYKGVNVENVFITHAHMDHIGTLFYIAERYKPRVYIHELEAKVMLYGKVVEDILREMDLEVILLKGNENIELPDRTLRVLYAPGHTPGTIMLYDVERGILFSSDVLFPMIGKHILLTQPDPVGGNLGELILSVRYIMRLKPKAFLPGHLFPVWENASDHAKRTYFELKLQEEKDRNLALISLGINLADIGELDEAITCFETVLKESPGHPGAMFVLALAYLQKGRIKDSFELLKELEKNHPDFKEAVELKKRVEFMLKSCD